MDTLLLLFVNSPNSVFTVVQNASNDSFSFYHEDASSAVTGSRFFLRMNADGVTTWHDEGAGKVTCAKHRSNDDMFIIQTKQKCIL